MSHTADSLPPEIPLSITREALNGLPIRRYEGPVHVLETPPDLERTMRDLRAERVIGFDTETRPAFRPGESYLPSVVQFATGSAVYLLQVQQQDCSAALREIFAAIDSLEKTPAPRRWEISWQDLSAAPTMAAGALLLAALALGSGPLRVETEAA